MFFVAVATVIEGPDLFFVAVATVIEGPDCASF
jgi:hypothetical protein